MIGCLRTRVRKQPIIALYFESETVLKFYNLGIRTRLCFFKNEISIIQSFKVQNLFLSSCPQFQKYGA